MTDDRHDQAGPEGTAPGAASAERHAAFFVLGLVLFLLGAAGLARGTLAWAAFLPVGIVLFALGAGGMTTGQADGSAGGRGRRTGGDGSAAGTDGDPRTDHGDASGPEDAGAGGGGGDGGGGGGGD